jgi:hypothetical protein
MKTNLETNARSLVRLAPVKTTSRALFSVGALLTAIAASGCSDGTQPITHRDCAALTATSSNSPAIRVSVEAKAGSSPDVSISGNGFPAGSPISIGYFGLPDVGTETAQIDLPALVDVNKDGSFSITQHGVYDLKSCDSDALGATISIAAAAGGTIVGTSAPASLWCANATSVESYDSACE